MLNLFHKPTHEHNWELVSKTYGAPRKDVSAQGIDQESLEKALFGVTVLFFKCPLCSEFKREELLGSDVDTLSDLMDKADEYGPQYVMQGEKTFAILRYIPQSQNVPVR